MDEKDKVCWSCDNYKPYYTKGFFEFFKEKVGYCLINKEIIDKNSTCERWQLKHYDKRKITSALEGLERGLSNLQVVRLILEELDEKTKLAEKQDDKK